MGRCTPCWNARPKKLGCRCTGLRAFPIRGGHWLLPSGRGGISHAFSPSYAKTSLTHTLVLGEDLEDPAVIDRYASASGIELAALHAALADDSAVAAVTETEMTGRKYGVQGTPAWLLDERLIAGLLPAAEFERLAEH